jgi:NADH-quinone oxidoreductase subunit L
VFDLSTENLWVLLPLIPGLPIFAALIVAIFGHRLGERSHYPVLLAVAGSAVIGLLALLHVKGLGADQGREAVFNYANWFQAGNLRVDWELRLDSLSAMMAAMVSFISLWIVLFSSGYMHGDPGYPRYFAAVSLFVGAMNLLVLANNLPLLFLGWEGVGVCSYLLIGFWFAKPEAAKAARKAFLVTRLGDVALLAGMILLYRAGDPVGLSYDTLLFRQYDPVTLYWALVCLGIGAFGKSAQFPLHVWLPDAMEGPTPVSALIHAATMVTAGVYLLARMLPPLTEHAVSPAQLAAVGDFQDIVLLSGGVTALLAALIALGQTDLKRILAYSTLSQLGYMFMALGVGSSQGTAESHVLVSAAAAASIFHLLTHAFFKALLFLSAGSVMHAMGNVLDLRRIGGLRKLLPITHVCFLIGALALAGLPPLSGFFSKDGILEALEHGAESGGRRALLQNIMLWIGLVTAALTGLYTIRAYLLTFWGPQRVPEEAGHHAHESPPVMTIPLAVLAVPAALIGLAIGPTHLFGHFIQTTPGWHPAESHPFAWKMAAIGLGAAALGVAVAFVLGDRRPARTPNNLVGASRSGFFIDDIYSSFITKPCEYGGRLLNFLDRELVDKVVELFARIPGWVGDSLRPLQNGLVQYYALAMALGLVVLIAMFTLAR